MAFTESLNRAGHMLVDLLTPNPNKNSERSLAQPLPAVDYSPVNEPGSKQPLVRNTWYRLVNMADREVGYMFACRCGASNPYIYGRYDLRRELEQDHPCCGRCVHIVEKKRAENEPAVIEQVRLTETVLDKKTHQPITLPLGAPHNLRNLLPDNGEKMSERERNMVYATLPTWRLVNEQRQAPFHQIGDWGGNLDPESAVQWDDSGSGISGKEYARRANINNGLW